jgi:hypothetical protein
MTCGYHTGLTQFLKKVKSPAAQLAAAWCSSRQVPAIFAAPGPYWSVTAFNISEGETH